MKYILYKKNPLMNWNINLFFMKMENGMCTLLVLQVALYLCFQLKMHLSRTALHQAACWFHQVYLVKGRLLISINIQSPFWFATCPPDVVRYNYQWNVKKISCTLVPFFPTKTSAYLKKNCICSQIKGDKVSMYECLPGSLFMT